MKAKRVDLKSSHYIHTQKLIVRMCGDGCYLKHTVEIVSHRILMFCVLNVGTVTWHLYVQHHMAAICSMSHDVPVFSVTWQPYAQCHMAFTCLVSHDIHVSGVM